MTDMLSRVKPTVFENDTTFGTNYQGYKLFVPVYHNTISDKSDIGALVFLATETRDNIAICLFSVKGCPNFWCVLGCLIVNKCRTHDDQVRTQWHDMENRPRCSEEVVELFME